MKYLNGISMFAMVSMVFAGHVSGMGYEQAQRQEAYYVQLAEFEPQVRHMMLVQGQAMVMSFQAGTNTLRRDFEAWRQTVTHDVPGLYDPQLRDAQATDFADRWLHELTYWQNRHIELRHARWVMERLIADNVPGLWVNLAQVYERPALLDKIKNVEGAVIQLGQQALLGLTMSNQYSMHYIQQWVEKTQALLEQDQPAI